MEDRDSMFYNTMNDHLYQDGPALTFDDVYLVPNYSALESRSEADITAEIAGIKLSLPIISANMDTVTSPEMALAMAHNGGLGILHRYATQEQVEKWIGWLADQAVPAIPSIGVGPKEVDKALAYIQAGANAICIDIAHGHSKAMGETIKALAGKTYIIAGNVATASGALSLIEWGANAVKVGIGPGAMCSTRVVTGHGIPQLSAIASIRDSMYMKHYDNPIVADGGIRNSGDIVKALAFGADLVMLGSLLAGTDESPGELLPNNKKIYRGMASEEAQVSFRGKVSNSAPEGVSTIIDCKGPVAAVLERLAGGIRSGLSYSGTLNIKQLQRDFKYVTVTHNGHIEGTPHGAK